MARHRRKSRFIFLFAFFVIAASVCAGGVAAWVTHMNTGPGETGGAPVRAADLKNYSRPQLEAEVARLHGELADRNQQLDDLKIQLKLATEGSKGSI